MTSQSPRIYIYKITFEEVLYYYYGSHKEKKYDEEYWGSPVTNKWCWELYTPKKQILQLFDYTDKGWLEALGVEKRVIKQFYNTDKWCLNENCAGGFSLSSLKNSLKSSIVKLRCCTNSDILSVLFSFKNSRIILIFAFPPVRN